jgi:hypothetical protein
MVAGDHGRVYQTLENPKLFTLSISQIFWNPSSPHTNTFLTESLGKDYFPHSICYIGFMRLYIYIYHYTSTLLVTASEIFNSLLKKLAGIFIPHVQLQI